MANFSLKARAALEGATHDFVGLSIRELTDTKLLSVAATADHQHRASNALHKLCGLSWPEITKSTTQDNRHALGLHQEQLFLMSDHGDHEHRELAQQLAESAVVTDQSDSWVVVALTGNRVHDVLERICPVDLHEGIFTDGSVARTSMEHVSVIVFRQGNRMILMSPRSSADSFMHTLVQSADFVI